MMTTVEQRRTRRYSHQVTALLEDPLSGYLAYAQMTNFSSDGMCFESDFAFKPGMTLAIKLEKPLFKGGGKTYHALSIWSNEKDDDDSEYPYEVGLLLVNEQNH
jgi:hypothetical protein